MGNIPDPDTCKTHPERKLPVSKAIAPSVVSYQFPVMIERSTLCMGQVALTAMISGLGTLPLAAHYLTNQTEGLLYLPHMAFPSLLLP